MTTPDSTFTPSGLPFTPDERTGLLKRQSEANAATETEDEMFAYAQLLRYEATVKALEDQIAEQNNRVEVEAVFIEKYAEAETSFELCQQLARRLRTCVIIGPRRNQGPAIMLTDHQLTALSEWADEGDRRDGVTAWGVKFTKVMEAARRVRDLSESHKPVKEE